MNSAPKVFSFPQLRTLNIQIFNYRSSQHRVILICILDYFCLEWIDIIKFSTRRLVRFPIFASCGSEYEVYYSRILMQLKRLEKYRNVFEFASTSDYANYWKRRRKSFSKTERILWLLHLLFHNVYPLFSNKTFYNFINSPILSDRQLGVSFQ